MSADLKACPWCGGTARVATMRLPALRYFAGCIGNECDVSPSTTAFDIEDAAIAAWNTRPDAARVAGGGDAARLDWLMRHVSGAEYRRLGLIYRDIAEVPALIDALLTPAPTEP